MFGRLRLAHCCSQRGSADEGSRAAIAADVGDGAAGGVRRRRRRQRLHPHVADRTPTTTPGISYAPGVYPAASTFANQCQVPRTGTDPSTGQRYPDMQGSSLAEKHFLRSWTNNLYLWFNEVADRDPASVPAVLDYFDTQKTTVVLPNGRNKDEFHFTYDTAEYYALSQSGTSVGYGISWDLVRSVPPPATGRPVRAGRDAGRCSRASRAAQKSCAWTASTWCQRQHAGRRRHAERGACSTRCRAPAHSLVFRDRDTGAQRTVSLTAGAVTLDPVPLVRVLPTASGNLGYLLFNDHIATAEQAAGRRHQPAACLATCRTWCSTCATTAAGSWSSRASWPT